MSENGANPFLFSVHFDGKTTELPQTHQAGNKFVFTAPNISPRREHGAKQWQQNRGGNKQPTQNQFNQGTASTGSNLKINPTRTLPPFAQNQNNLNYKLIAEPNSALRLALAQTEFETNKTSN